MALITICAVPDIALNAPVDWVCLSFRMTICAHEDRVVGGIRVAIAAQLRVVMRNPEPRVVERCPQPARRVVAGIASGRESCRNVVRIRRCLVIGLVARIAIRRRPRIHSANVTTAAGHVDVGPGQRERSFIVIEYRSGPTRRVVADRAVRGEASLHVVRIRRALVIFDVAGIAIRRRACKFSVDVALRARNVYMGSGQRKWRLRVIEYRASPRCRRVANRAVRRETRLHVIRIRCALVILDVARIAIGRRARKFTVDVALHTGDVHMSAGQRKLCEPVVIESRACPA